jgi:GNAT superfamily N-acetyltransferase
VVTSTARSRSPRGACCSSWRIATRRRRPRSSASSGSTPDTSAGCSSDCSDDGSCVAPARPHDGRESHIALTTAGRAAFPKARSRLRGARRQLLATLDDAAQRRLVDAIRTIGDLLGAPEVAGSRAAPSYILRPPGAADYGWIIQSHADVYAREYGWGPRFLALVARVISDYIDGFDPALERCWIAERNGQNVGSVFVAKDSTRPGVAKLRMLLVLPSARGLGIGKRLVDECTRFAREAGYHTLSLWTNSVLTTARQIYADAGYVLVRTEVHDTFGKPLTAETWELTL